MTAVEGRFANMIHRRMVEGKLRTRPRSAEKNVRGRMLGKVWVSARLGGGAVFTSREMDVLVDVLREAGVELAPFEEPRSKKLEELAALE